MNASKPFGGRPLSVGVQSVLFGNDLSAIVRAAVALARAAEIAVGGGACTGVTLRYGDSSAAPCLAPGDLDRLRGLCGPALAIDYLFFDGNLGSAGGHNRLAEGQAADMLLIQNPDVVVSPRLIEIMLGAFRIPGTGMVEAKQLPIEHPKDYDVRTGETSWATTASAMIPAPLYAALGGFDADSFFLYCDDVDFSWRVRLAGFKVVFQPAAVVFHDKRLSRDGEWQPSSAERYYSAEAALLLTHKWSRSDLTEKTLRTFEASGADHLLRAAAAFRTRRREGRLSQPLDPDHRIGQFVGDAYAPHRFPL